MQDGKIIKIKAEGYDLVNEESSGGYSIQNE